MADEFNMTKATLSGNSQNSGTQRTDLQNFLNHMTLEVTSFILQKKGRVIAEKSSVFSEQIQVPIDKLSSGMIKNVCY